MDMAEGMRVEVQQTFNKNAKLYESSSKILARRWSETGSASRPIGSTTTRTFRMLCKRH